MGIAKRTYVPPTAWATASLTSSICSGLSVGSTNFDNRFRLNDEATLNDVDKAFASLQTATFEADLSESRQMTHA
jgi:hypothetical protein